MGSQIRREIQGRRPAPLQIARDSHKIGKIVLPIRSMRTRQPVIIYTKSPKVIHTEAQHFMALVQRLTGSDSRHEHGKNPTAEHEAISSRDSPVLISSFENMNTCSTDASHSHSICSEAAIEDSRVSESDQSHEYSVQAASSCSSVAVVDSAASCSQYVSTSLPPLSPNSVVVDVDYFWS